MRSQELRELARKALTRAAHIVACPPPHLLFRGSLASCRFLAAFSIPIMHEMRGTAVDANRSKSHLSLPLGGGEVSLTKAANKDIISISAANYSNQSQGT